jgi:hypothetical protein
MLAASAARGGELLVTQAGVTAILVFAAHADSAGSAVARFGDALIGGGCAGLVSLFILPPDPVELLVSRFQALHTELADVLDDIADALRRQDADQAAAALERARATGGLVEALHAARPVAVEIARFVPAHRRARERVSRLADASVHLDHAIRNTRVYARAALALLPSAAPVRYACASAAAELAEAVRRLDPELAGNAAQRAATLHRQDPSLTLGAVAAAGRGIADDLVLVGRGFESLHPLRQGLRRRPFVCVAAAVRSNLSVGRPRRVATSDRRSRAGG